jgi:dCTP deaminase
MKTNYFTSHKNLIEPNKALGKKQLATALRQDGLSGVMSDKEIAALYNSGDIIIHPLATGDISRIKGSSIDLRLGKFYFRVGQNYHEKYLNAFDKKSINDYFGPYQSAIPHDLWCQQNKAKPFKGISKDSLIIVLAPGERILGHTHEFVGISSGIGTSSMYARSSSGRLGLAVCGDSGWGDPGYINRWALEISNNNPYHTPLVVGARYMQIVFYWTGIVEQDYGKIGNYQSSTSLQELIDNWHPNKLLPNILQTEGDMLEPLDIDNKF